MSDKMPPDAALKAGNSAQNPGNQRHLALVPGGQYGLRETKPSPRRHDAPDPLFDRDVRGIYARWKRGGTGAYASRAIANVAESISHPARVIDRHLEDAILGDVPLEWVKELGRRLVQRVDELAAKHGRLTA